MTTQACNLIKVILEHDRILQELRTRIKGGISPRLSANLQWPTYEVHYPPDHARVSETVDQKFWQESKY